LAFAKLYSLVTERVGRKWALQLSVSIFIIGAVLMTVTTGQLGMICKKETFDLQVYQTDRVYKMLGEF
jgi:hypothetical protein